MSKPKEFTTPRADLKVNDRLWYVQVGSSIVTNTPLWWRMLIVEETVFGEERMDMGTLYFVLSFVVNKKVL